MTLKITDFIRSRTEFITIIRHFHTYISTFCLTIDRRLIGVVARRKEKKVTWSGATTLTLTCV